MESGVITSVHGEESPLDKDLKKFGCEHYQRRCKIRAPCCDEIFACRLCHNDAKNSFELDPLDRHDVPRHDILKVICSLCNMEQDVQQTCVSCGVCFGKYFCSKCKLFDDDISKKQYHCDKCGICRIGGEENFFHCDRCECCYSNKLKDSHKCVEKAMHHNCAVCFEYLFDTTSDIAVLPCGHTIHLACVREMEQHYQYACPVCLKSYCDMRHVWAAIDQEIASTPMPQVYCDNRVWILCNDCGEKSQVNFHVVAMKCLKCNSYNTRQMRGERNDATLSSGISEMVS